MKLLLIGAQGSGKGTAAEELSKIYNISTISTGDLFRAEVSSGSILGNKLKLFMDAGALVPDDLTVEVLSERLKQDDCKNGYILDGFPRNLQQAKLLDKITKIDMVVFLDVSFDIVLKRIAGRRTCPNCKHIHNLRYPGDPNFCSVCGTKYIIRTDDTEAAIKQRLNTFTEKTMPVVEYYKRKGLVLSVDAGHTPEYTLNQIIKGLGK